ncbi:S-layer homology domain-containing protein [Bacillus sp. 1P06AnD]|uniref:S-layer homology domain-containing protein n=1 Tax=Bacillus sp. 1P06AnD TaxID=3132208 RepID=UPI0039A2A418
MQTKKVIVSTVLGASLLFNAVPFAGTTGNIMDVKASTIVQNAIFKDVPASSFAFSAINDLVNRKVVYGYSKDKFDPTGTVTRGQFATMLARALNLPLADSKFKDLPKSKALYKDVSRAAVAGLIKGNTKGYVYPEKAVSRADIAVMIDRAMNIKGKFTESTNLSFKDSGSIPNYALESVKRMTKYGIISGKSNNTFAGGEFADRATSSVFVYRMLNVLENNTSSTPTPPVTQPEKPTTPPTTNPGQPSGDWHKWSINQIESVVGEYKVLERSGDKIFEQDYVKLYHETLNDPRYSQSMKSPQEYFKGMTEELELSYRNLYNSYPKKEVISFNDVPFRNSKIFSKTIATPTSSFNKGLAATVPTPPTIDGNNLIDLHTYTKNAVTYSNNKAKVTTLKNTPLAVADNTDFLVDFVSLFKNTNNMVKVTNGGYTLEFEGNIVKLQKNSNMATVNGQKVTLSAKVTEDNSVVSGPIVSIADKLGLSTRQMTPKYPTALRVEIANYPLEKDGFYWID